MARTIAQIKDIIKTKARTFTSLDALLFEDDAGAITGSAFIDTVDTVATAQNTFEVLADQTKVDIKAIADAAPTGNAKWIQSQILKFQFGDIIEIGDDYVPFYPVLDQTKKIVTRCAVFSDKVTGLVEIKVAKSEDPPEPLSAAELVALEDYYYGTSDTQGIGFAGVKAEFTNQDPDRLYVEGKIIYLGQFDPNTVKTNVIQAIEDFIAGFQNENFAGTIKMQRLEDAILAVEGVSRFKFATNGIRARDFNTPFSSSTVVSPDGFYNTISGYAISEDEAGETLTDKITTELESA